MDLIQELKVFVESEKMGGGYFQSATKALSALDEGKAFIVQCSWDTYNAPGYNAVARPLYEDLPPGHPVRIHKYDILFAPFSATAPGRVGVGRGKNLSWMVVSLKDDDES